MIKHSNIDSSALLKKIRRNEILFAGNSKLKIYGLLHCSSGKRMKKENRVFFSSLEEAAGNNYRPCGHCIREEYLKWRNKI